ncbi:MAG TPA: glutamine--fructose-6-phosphate transaminase (isomerizing) [Nitrospinota bacterium]|nr:glutamine--fructose-6-phosphate transaminase (isomerizing) [Nitrospinota bacterium]
MCGIIGYIGNRDAVPILLDGLKRLEYRGYDSAGISTIDNNKLVVRRSVGKLRNLEENIKDNPLGGKIGIGHTRWATHGRPSEENAHPHRVNGVVVVHNGIIENYLALKEELIKEGSVFTSNTDTEVIAHLIHKYFEGNLEEAVKKALHRIVGAYAIGVICEQDPKKIVAARKHSPLVIGLGKGEFFIASDIPAILGHTREAFFLEDGEIAILTEEGVKISDLMGRPKSKEVKKVLWNLVMAEKSGYKHFMLKEIYEQPRAIWDTFRGRISQETGDIILLDEIKMDKESIKEIKKIFIVACGTSYHAALVGKYIIEEICKMPVEVDIASEFRYRDPLIDKESLTVFISQSGETADTIAALEEAKKKGAKVISICNVMESTIARDSHEVIYTHAGPEIGVASTKAFTTQIVALYLLGILIAKLNKTISEKRSKDLMKDLVKIPEQVESILNQDERIEEISRIYSDRKDFLFLGRGINYPIALEGALKLKEISYIHAEGYPAGEMKHGPIALIDESMPVVVLAPKNRVYEKILNNIEEVKTRDGIVIVLTNEENKELEEKVDHVLYIPKTSYFLEPILLVVPLQLLAYHIAVRRGCDVDQPRNLAKSVTVE